MNAAQAARRVTELCLAENRSLSDELMAWASGSAAAAAGGDLKSALRQLGFDEQLATLGATHPPALAPARRLLAELPAASVIRVPLAQTAVWFGLLAALQLAVLAMLEASVFPALSTVRDVHHLPPPVWADLAGVLLPVVTWVLAAVGVVGWLSPAWMPGWGRTLRRAREAAIGAGLAETAPPEGVWSQWIRGSPLLQRLGAATATDLRALAHESSRCAEQQMAHFVTAYRVAGLALLTLVALTLTAYVYSACASLVAAS